MTNVVPKEHDLLDYNNVDWEDIKSVSRHWKLFLKALEMEIEQHDD